MANPLMTVSIPRNGTGVAAFFDDTCRSGVHNRFGDTQEQWEVVPVNNQMLRLTFGVCMAVSMALAGGCLSTKTSDRDLVFVDPAEGMEIVRGERQGLVLGTVRGVWVDPRSVSEFREGHIPGAVHLPLERARDEHSRLEDYTTIVVYGEDYNSPLAHALSKTLLELGYDDVRTLRGGLRAWQAAGNPVETGD